MSDIQGQRWEGENDVEPGSACPQCGERDMDKLVWSRRWRGSSGAWSGPDSAMYVECQTCGAEYTPFDTSGGMSQEEQAAQDWYFSGRGKDDRDSAAREGRIW